MASSGAQRRRDIRKKRSGVSHSVALEVLNYVETNSHDEELRRNEELRRTVEFLESLEQEHEAHVKWVKASENKLARYRPAWFVGAQIPNSTRPTTARPHKVQPKSTGGPLLPLEVAQQLQTLKCLNHKCSNEIQN